MYQLDLIRSSLAHSFCISAILVAYLARFQFHLYASASACISLCCRTLVCTTTTFTEVAIFATAIRFFSEFSRFERRVSSHRVQARDALFAHCQIFDRTLRASRTDIFAITLSDQETVASRENCGKR